MKTLQLVQQVADIIAQGEDSGTPSQHTEVRGRLRSVLLQLIDVGVSSPSAGSRELGAVIQLLKLTLEKVPNWLTGDTNSLLLDIIERFLPRLTRPLETKAAGDLVDAITLILNRIALTESEQFVALFKHLCDLFNDVYTVAVKLSADPRCTAAVKCSISALGSADSVQGRVQLELDSSASCDRVMQTLLKVMADVVNAHPITLAPLLPAALLRGATSLLACSSTLLQAAALQFIRATLRASFCIPLELKTVPDRLLFTFQSFLLHSTLSTPAVKAEWLRQFTLVLNVLMDVSATGASGAGIREQAIYIAATAAESAQPKSAEQDQLVRTFAEAAVKEPLAMQRHAHMLEAVLPVCSLASRGALLAAVRCCFGTVDVEEASKAIESAFAAQEKAGNAAADNNNDGAATSSKRRRISRPDTTISNETLDPTVSLIATTLLRVCKKLQRATTAGFGGSDHAVHALADIALAISPLAPRVSMQLALSGLSGWSTWARISSGTRGLPAAALSAAAHLTCALLDATLRNNEQPGSERSALFKNNENFYATVQGMLIAITQCEGATDSYAMAAALLAAQLDLLDSTNTVFKVLASCDAQSTGAAQLAKTTLLPAAAFITGAKGIGGSGNAATALHGSQPSRRQRQSAETPGNPFIAPVQEAAASSDKAQRAALIRGVLVVVEWAHDPSSIAMHAARAAISLAYPAQGSAQDSRATLTSATCDWLHPTLDTLCKNPAEGGDLVAAVRGFLQFAVLSHLEQSCGLARWLLAQAISPVQDVRAAVVRGCDFFSSSRFLLAAYHKGAHPVHTTDRRAAAEHCEQDAILDIKSRIASSTKDADAVEDLLQLITKVGYSMRSPTAQKLMIAILMKSLEHKNAGVSAAAAQCLRGIASARNCSVRELFFSTPQLLEHMGKMLPVSPDLLHELAALLGMPRRALAVAVLPKTLPALFLKNDRAGVEALGQLAGLTPERLMLEHGHYPVAASILHDTPPIDIFMPLAEEVSGKDFIALARAIMPRTVTEMVVQTGSRTDWGVEGGMPDPAIKHTSDMLLLFATETAETQNEVAVAGNSGATSSVRASSTAEFLADGDHVTRMLKEFGDSLDARLPAVQTPSPAAADIVAALGVLRSVLVLVRLTGPFVGRFLPQFMVLFGAAVRPANHKDVRLQGLSGWLYLVKALASEAPLQLGGVVSQVVVTLMESLQESGAMGAAAARVVEELIAACRVHFPDKLRSMPPLPQWPAELRHVNTLLAEERGNLTVHEHVGLLLESLGNESLSVRSTALQELRTLLASRRDMLLTLQTSNPELLKQLVGTLLKTSEPEANNAASVAVQQACAECLGMLGAVDPSRIHLDPQPPLKMCRSASQLAVELMTKHLVRLLKTAPTMQTLDLTTLAIQDVLRCHTTGAEPLADAEAPAAAPLKSKRSPPARQKGKEKDKKGPARPSTPQPEAIFSLLPDEIQAIVRPYLDSKYSIRTSGKKCDGVVFTPSGMSLRRWLALWLSQLTEKHASGDLLPLFRAVNPVIRFDIPTALYLAPYLVHNVVAHGGRAAAADVVAEVNAVLRADATSRDGVLCMQAVFTLLDVLKRWCEEAKASSAAASKTSGATNTTTATSGASGAAPTDEDSKEWGSVRSMLASIPRDTLAQAAAQCGAHARALLQFEEHIRELRGGGANPVAARSPTFSDSEVTFLLEVYSRLEEPDGLDGLVKLRQGGPKPEDQRLAAEKMGAWGEALTLYERDLARGDAAAGAAGASGSGNSAAPDSTRRGYLNCLLQMGHWQSLLTVVEGMAVQRGHGGLNGGSGDLAQLAAMGTAAAWRLGRWDQLAGYLSAAEAGSSSLDADERWEVRIARLLRAISTYGDKGDAAAGGGMGADALVAELNGARAEVMGPFSAAAMESYSRAYPQLVKLHMLQEIADTASCMEKSLGARDRRRALRWDNRLSATQASLTTQAPILALRRQLASLAGWSADAGQCWLQHAQLCRATGHFDAAIPAVLEASTAGVPGSSLERVELLYARGDAHRALSELRCLESQLADGGGDGAALKTDGERATYRARVLLRLAEWTAETGQGTREEVTGLFDSALALRDKWETGLFRYAAYLDQLMQDAKSRQEVQGQQGPGADRLDGKSRIKLGEDRPYLSFLPEVLRGYGSSIKAGHTHIYRSLPRLLTLWFEFGAAAAKKNAGAEREIEGSVMDSMRSLAKSAPMHCWLTALPQLISRICHRNADVAALTRHLVTQITIEYPQQALWALAAVSKSTIPQRRSAANAILSSAKRAAHSEDARRVFVENNSFCEQLIKLSSLIPPANKRFMSAKELGHLTRIMPLEVMMPVHHALTPSLPSGSAAAPGWRPFIDVVTISGIQDQIEIMTSLQKPKRIVLIGSDGRHYPFLAKPKDDLRKDNRMMEVAGVVNRLFREDPGARRRNLHLRRFAVLPITEESGLIEWVERTRHIRGCISSTLVDAGINIRDMNVAVRDAYERMIKANAGRSTAAPMLKWFESTLREFPPCYHKWFLQTFPEPAAWLNSRLAYTRTYAAWCVVGHVVGLGDRHGENVLIDMSSGDAFQIDFGCLFDKGLTLQNPEVVPFRLTQNVVDAFGVAGVEGVYRRSFEVTLGVLRTNRDIILPIMDTFVHDPLVDWAKSKVRDGGGESENPQARDWLATMEGRLRGTLLGVSSRPCMPSLLKATLID